MALQKQPVVINFSGNLDTKSDPNQLQLGKFTALNNMVRDTAGRLTKRNGFANITALPNAAQTTLTTFNGNLLATGSNLYAYSSATNTWLNEGAIQPVSLSTLPVVRASTSQSAPDMAVSQSGLVCTVYVDGGIAYYQISDSTTGQLIVPRQMLDSTAKNPRVTLLNNYFVITYAYLNGGLPNLAFKVIPTASPSTLGSVTQITSLLSATTAPYDVVVQSGYMYFAWNASDGSLKMRWITASFTPSTVTTIPATQATQIALTADAATQNIWLAYYTTSFSVLATCYSTQLGTVVLAPTTIATSVPVNTITIVAASSLCTILYETSNSYSVPYPTANVQSNYISRATVTQAGVVVAPVVMLRSVGLASKAFIGPTGTIYMLATYGASSAPTSSNQSTYFLIDSTGAVYLRLASSNGGGYASSFVLPNVSLINSQYIIPYLIKDFLATINKGTSLPAGTPVNAIYTQVGINLAKFGINTVGQYSSEIAGCLHLTGGQLWQYDGVKPVEHNFHVFPENVAVTTATGAGALTANTYYYAFCYEWTDGQGNLHRSAPSIPTRVTTTTASSTNTIYVPTLRLTYKTGNNPVKIVGYRWSGAQQTYYQFTSLTSPIVNDPTIDYVTIVDAAADSAILGQTLLYTTGGVVEDTAAPACSSSALFKSRLFLIDAEDPNTLWFSKQVIPATPVEMSDLLTLYIAPTSGSQGSTGPMTALGAMDDKLIIFKRGAIYYLTGSGPDNTGANNDFSDPIFVTSSVGCTNPSSIALVPDGLMFQSDKGIWLLGRDLSTQYVGNDVELYNSQMVESATPIPGTNQVRFTLGSNVTLVYDYYFKQWATFSNIQAISSTLYQNTHTYLNKLGQVFQESPGVYLDGSVPVLMSFTTAWLNIAGLRGYERFYYMLLLGTYITPFKLSVQLAYDFNPSASQAITVTPDNYAPNWGGEAVWGSGSAWGGPGQPFEARVFPQQQKCQSFQITVLENYDPVFAVPAGQGLTLSGLNLVVGIKKGYSPQKASRSFG